MFAGRISVAICPFLARAGAPFDSGTLGAKVIAACFAYVALRSAAAALGRPQRAFVGILLFTPLLLLAAGGPLRGYAASQSGEPLARSIADMAPGGRVRCVGCYSPGTDFLLGRRSELVSATGHETTSNYQVRYRETLRARGRWTPLAAGADTGRVEVVVLPAGAAAEGPPGYLPFFRDERFAAFVRSS
mgnify:FL=1